MQQLQVIQIIQTRAYKLHLVLAKYLNSATVTLA